MMISLHRWVTHILATLPSRQATHDPSCGKIAAFQVRSIVRLVATSSVAFASLSAIAASATAADARPTKQANRASTADWYGPGERRVLPAYAEHANPSGRLGFIYTGGPLETDGHPFFEPLSENGRACVSCHQPADAMSLSLRTIRERWEATDGKDPLFAAIDGSNCPNLPQGRPESHSLLLERGLFRIALPWPPKARDGSPIEPEFDIEVAADPTGCNTDAAHGLQAGTISVFRRPRVAANLTHVIRPRNVFNTKTGYPVDKDPDTGERVSMNLLSDARQPTLKMQASEAAAAHLEHSKPLEQPMLQQIVDFQSRVFVAQAEDLRAGSLTVPGTPPSLGPHAIAHQKTGGLGDNLENPVFGNFDAWRSRTERDGTASIRSRHQASIARGHDVFFLRPFWIRDAVHLNSIGLGNPIKRTCSTCHNAIMTGQDIAPGWMDIGVANQPWANPRPDLPLFKVTCKASAVPHPYLGRTIFTHDPGRALISGRCEDIGSINIQQMRGLAARAPYFSNGSARDLQELVEFYDRRFEMQLTEQEREDLVNFLSVL